MKALMDRRLVRIIAFILLLASIAVGSLSVAIWRYGRYDNWNNNHYMGFVDTISCQNFVSNGLRYVEENIGYVDPAEYDNLGSYAGRAFSYQIVINNGYIVVDTTTEDSIYVSSLSDTYNGISYVINGYINLPVGEYDGCYAEYLFYESCMPVFSHRVEITLGSFALAAILLVFLLVAFYRAGKQGQLSGILKLPLEVVFLILVGAYALISTIESSGRMWRLILYYPSIIQALRNVYWYFVIFAILAGFLCLAAAQLGARCLWNRLILVRACQKIPLGVWILLIAVLNAIFLWLAWSTILQRRVWIVALIPVNGAAIIFAEYFRRQGRKVQRAVRELSEGNLSYKVNTAHMGAFWNNIGTQLNHIGDGMVNAVEERMKSERLKTELITNVSHDLKTPLTSIINYIQLLKDDSLSPVVKEEYLGILDRQSAKLKKLTEDVVEASKAASGVLAVNAEKLNAGECLEQIIGEFEARMCEADLEAVVRLPDEPIYLMADSVLFGRILENLMTNIVKYAMQGTRVYFDLNSKDDMLVLSVKNISREALNISADELMERFVRGDSSRHSEGSGLGLSIAKSLAELMGGRLDIILDGDLFKAEIVFPKL